MVQALESLKRVSVWFCIEQRQVSSAAAHIKADLAQLTKRYRASMASLDLDSIRGKIESRPDRLLGRDAVLRATNDNRPTAVECETMKRAGNRPGTAQDIANSVVFFASELGGFVNGQVLAVDGGK